MHVMADEDEGAFKLLQGQDEAFDGPDVQVGRRLVHEQQVRRIDEELHEVQAALFTTGEHLALLVHVLALEEEAAEDAAGLVFTDFR